MKEIYIGNFNIHTLLKEYLLKNIIVFPITFTSVHVRTSGCEISTRKKDTNTKYDKKQPKTKNINNGPSILSLPFPLSAFNLFKCY